VSALRPRALRPGDTVGVCAPSGPVNPDRLARGVSALEELGYRVRVGDAVRKRRRFTAGTPEERLADLHALWADDAVAAIVCARGGAGAVQIIDRLDLDLVRAHPKIFVGYSDLTLVHLALGRLGQVSVHGPMAAIELADGTFDRTSFAAATAGGPRYRSDPEDLETIVPGTAEGVLRGGCLSLLANAVGTPWELRPDEDTILFLEDVDEAPYRIDRMLWQLRSAGTLARVRGIVFGDMRGCAPPLEADFGLQDVIREVLAPLGVPVALGLSSGHTNCPSVSLPLGVEARLTSAEDEVRLEVTGDAVA
jgi:muramoyltetrapeptide carboxypeptidase